MCEGDYWNRDEKVMFQHQDTGVYLSASGHTFGRPINGQVLSFIIRDALDSKFAGYPVAFFYQTPDLWLNLH